MSTERQWKKGDFVRVTLNAGNGGYFGRVHAVEGDKIIVSQGSAGTMYGLQLVREDKERVSDANEWRKANPR